MSHDEVLQIARALKGEEGKKWRNWKMLQFKCELVVVARVLTVIYLHAYGVGRNGVGEEGERALAEALKVNSTLTYLGLECK